MWKNWNQHCQAQGQHMSPKHSPIASVLIVIFSQRMIWDSINLSLSLCISLSSIKFLLTRETHACPSCGFHRRFCPCQGRWEKSWYAPRVLQILSFLIYPFSLICTFWDKPRLRANCSLVGLFMIILLIMTTANLMRKI